MLDEIHFSCYNKRKNSEKGPPTMTTRKITQDEALGYIMNTDLENLVSLRGSIDARIKMVASTVKYELVPGDVVYFINKRSTKLPKGQVFGTIVKVNITKAKVDCGAYGIWLVPFTELVKGKEA